MLGIALYGIGLGVVSSSPLFETPFRIRAGEEFINVDAYHAAPCYEDIDGDGLKELLVGQYLEGKIRVYRNHGTNSAPEFRDFSWLEAGGQVVAVGGT